MITDPFLCLLIPVLISALLITMGALGVTWYLWRALRSERRGRRPTKQ